MRKVILSLGVLMGALAYSQVGINTLDPKATLDVTAKATDGSKAEGLIAPRLTGDALKAAETAGVYGTAQNGAIVYATAAATTPGTGQVENVTAAGYYYFDATANKWVTLEANDWHLTGNKGTTAGTNFLGTTDNQDLVFKRNNIQAGLLNNSLKNTAFGVGAFSGTPIANAEAYPGSGRANVALGYGSLASNTTGFGNIAIGSGAAQKQTTAQFSIAIGHGALNKNVNGNFNTAIGWWALDKTVGDGLTDGLGNQNTGVGSFSLLSNTTGSSNVAVGGNAIYQSTTASKNTGVGTNVLESTTTGSENVAMGYKALASGFQGSFNVAIGNETLSNLTDTATATSPDLNTAIGYKAGKDLNKGSNNNILIGANTSLAAEGTSAPNANKMNIGNVIFGKEMTGVLVPNPIGDTYTPAGKIGINTFSPGASLEVNGITANTSGLKFTKLTSATPVTSGAVPLGVDASGNVVVASTFTASSLTVGDIKTGLQTADHNGWIKLDGRLKSTLTSTQQTQATTLGIGTNLPDATGSVLMQNGTTLGSVSGNNAKTIAQNQLPNVSVKIAHSSIQTGLSSGNELLSDNDKTITAAGDGPSIWNYSFGRTTSVANAGNSSSINGNVTQQTLDVTPKSISVNTFIYLGN